ncbi:CehA/McbA family metallohydrolase [Congregibacter litoralis]|uniref:Periplasmic component of the Tol biopolymer transport system n=1 Tax=Congregibacter litoralis KT71 TaxID=314285 RepID=A4ABR9_9GAMM|nr:CehA/McbA family metallohydrolase [Congregibacter litoralis]EAQ96582.1 Periplasmic component of the Tol biopolymer transport system [Congregibacter litoralis KT71]
MSGIICRSLITLLFASVCSVSVQAQFTNRYPKLDDFGHQIYLEQHELPILAHGPTDPAPSPDGESIAFAAQGWLWLLDLDSGIARRLTRGGDVDSRPRWSADGRRLAFVRDTGKDTSLVVMDVAGGDETIINTPAIDLDPEFSGDGESLYYASGQSGSIDIWRHHFASGHSERITALRQVERNVRRVPGSDSILYLDGQGPSRQLRLRNFLTGSDISAHAETLTYHLSADVHPVERLVVFSAPRENDYHLWTKDLDHPGVRKQLTFGEGYALTPAFSADGTSIYFVEADAARQFQLKTVPTYGGKVETVKITAWNYGKKTGQLRLAPQDVRGDIVSARVSIVDEQGHPVASPSDATYFDPQSGRNYFYTDGEEVMTLPVGTYDITATNGPLTPLVRQTVVVRANKAADLALRLEPVWDARKAGYIAADYHNHLNGDGHNRANHGHALRVQKGESLHHMSPMSWNRWERKIDRELLGTQTRSEGFVVSQGQEVRSHFHGHIGLVGVQEPFAPWFFGPRNPTLGDPDLSNGMVFDYARDRNLFPIYVHPASADEDPFSPALIARLPIELVSDAVLEDNFGLETVIGWSSPLGTSQLWYRLLNVGRSVPAMSGTDAWVDFYRTPAVGTGRNYLPVESADGDFATIFREATTGRGFVSTGPAILFELNDGSQPGDVTRAGSHSWSAFVASTVDLEKLEIIVNGEVVARRSSVSAGEAQTMSGDIVLPEAGWVAARVYSAERQTDPWPMMHPRPFAHSAPIWIGERGSSDPEARAKAAGDMIRAIEAAEQTSRDAYGEVQVSTLMDRLAAAKALLRDMTLPEQ